MMRLNPRPIVACPICEVELEVDTASKGVRTVGGGVDVELAVHMFKQHGRKYVVREMGQERNDNARELGVDRGMMEHSCKVRL